MITPGSTSVLDAEVLLAVEGAAGGLFDAHLEIVVGAGRPFEVENATGRHQ